MVAFMVRRLPLRWVVAAAFGPLTGPLALQSLAYARAGDRIAALAYACAIPAVWLHLTALAVLPWNL